QRTDVVRQLLRYLILCPQFFPEHFLAGRSASPHLGEPNRRELIGALALKPIGGLAVRSCRSLFSASLVARRDLSRQYAELIDVHLDRGHYCLIAVVSLVASLLKPQMLGLGDCRIRIVSHDPSPSQCRLSISAPNMAVSRRPRGAIWAAYLFALNIHPN